MESVLASACGAFLLTAAALKLVDRTGAAVALATYGIGAAFARALVPALIAWEVVLAAGLLAGAPGTAIAATVTFALFAAAQAAALATGRGGMACGCLGATGRLSPLSAGRALALALASGWLAARPVSSPLANDLPLAAAALAFAAVAFALLHRRPPQGALDIAGEGPQLGSTTALTRWLPEPDGRLRLAVFTSAGCGLCRALGPAMAALVAEGRIVLRTFEAEREREVWEAVEAPGAPYAVVVAADGTVVAKGTVNTERQLRGVVADAHARAGLPLAIASGTDSRRDFLGRAAGLAGAAAAAPAIAALVDPGEAQAFHFCGHIYTTDGCPHPTGLPRIDSRGMPLRAQDGRQVDDLGRMIDASGLPVDDAGRPLVDPDGRRLPAAPRTPLCRTVGRRYGFRTRIDGAWYRCCGGHVRKLIDCCADHGRRINGDGALTGYCYQGRKVFCVMYYDTKVKC